MANYLDGLVNTNRTNSGSSSAGLAARGIAAVTSIVSGTLGSKPKALHTEYASGEANWQKPYGSGTDIVFYMVRAGGSGGKNPGAGSLGSSNLGGLEAVGAIFGAAVQTGLSFLGGNVQSSLSQVAVGTAMSKLSKSVGKSKGLAGPLTGLVTGATAKIGGTSQAFALSDSTAESVSNITQTVGSLETPRLSNVASQRFFQDTLDRSFAPDQVFAKGSRTSADILSSMNTGAVSDLSTMLASASGGVTTSTQFIEGINEGLIGFSTGSSNAESQRLGPNGKSRERLAK